MTELKKQLIKEEERLNNIIHVVDERLRNMPEGYLRISSTGNYTQYILTQSTGKNQKKYTYLRKDDLPTIRSLAQKTYDQKIKVLAGKRLRQLQTIIRNYSDDEIELIYDKLSPSRKELITPVEPIWEQRVAQWKTIPYRGKEFKDGQVEIYTKKGERVRSKSEKILADMFYDKGIEYKYECPLRLNGYGIVYPDFTFLSKKTHEEIYWEHDGKMDEPEYVAKAIRKIDHYTRNNIIPGKRLIITYESSTYALNTNIAEKLINEFLI